MDTPPAVPGSALDFLVPLPRELELLPGRLFLGSALALQRSENFDPPALERLPRLLAEKGCVLEDGHAPGSRWARGAAAPRLVLQRTREPARPREGYGLSIDEAGVRLEAPRDAGLAHGLSTLTQLVRGAGRPGGDADGPWLPCLRIEDAPAFERRGVMLDVSRDRVPRMDFLRELVDRLAEWKLNELQLYVEHTFAYREHELVWRGVDPLGHDELSELDAYCAERGIELVPNQQSFGHLHHWLVHEPYRALAELPAGLLHPFLEAGSTRPEPFSLCPTDPASLDFLAGLFDELLPCFRSGELNVGLDETIDLSAEGPGRSAAACRERGVGRVYLDFLRGVHGLVSARGKRMQFWADILLHHRELVGEVPRDALACLWGYEAEHPFEAETRVLAEAGLDFHVCPGTSSWQSLAGRIDNMGANVHAAALWGAARGARGLLVADWGDRGHLQPPVASWAGFLTAADVAWNPQSVVREHGREAEGWLARALALHVYQDDTGLLGRASTTLGHVARATGVRVPNASPLSLLLTRFEAPFPAPASAGPKGAALNPSQEGLEQARQFAIWGESQAGSSDPRAADGALARQEWSWVARTLRFACELGLVRLEHLDGRPLTALRAYDRKRLEEQLIPLIEEHQVLWPGRSRPGGLARSTRWLERVLEALRGLA